MGVVCGHSCMGFCFIERIFLVFYVSGFTLFFLPDNLLLYVTISVRYKYIKHLFVQCSLQFFHLGSSLISFPFPSLLVAHFLLFLFVSLPMVNTSIFFFIFKL